MFLKPEGYCIITKGGAQGDYANSQVIESDYSLLISYYQLHRRVTNQTLASCRLSKVK